jgi:HPt (histidine-containing phosphotransfer) domain-containing protein
MSNEEVTAALEGLRAEFRGRLAREADEIDTLFDAARDARDAAARIIAARRLMQVVHGLAGAGGTFGFPEISALAAALDDELAADLNAGAPAAPDWPYRRVVEVARLAALCRREADARDSA